MSKKHKATKLVKEFQHHKRETWESRLTLTNVATKLLCVECTQASGEPTVKTAVDFKPMAKVAVLECGHERPVTTLPSSMLKPEITREERKIVGRFIEAGETDTAREQLECELMDNMLRQMEQGNGLRMSASECVGAVDGN